MSATSGVMLFWSPAHLFGRFLYLSYKLTDVETWAKRCLTDIRPSDTLEDQGQKNKNHMRFLCWLWESCVEHILQDLGYCPKEQADKLPRIWWIGTGVASSLPFHAAGDHHSLDSTQNTLARVISSYTPTLKAPSYARERAAKATNISDHKPKLLITVMPTTPSQVPLQGVEQEAMQVQKVVKDCLAVRYVVCPEAKEVLACMNDYDVVHFACHGLSDPVDPSESGLILQRREPHNVEPHPDRLTVRQISDLHLKNACIAFLSACSTAQNKVWRLEDEVIHLASGFQVAGFAHVIGLDVVVRGRYLRGNGERVLRRTDGPRVE